MIGAPTAARGLKKWKTLPVRRWMLASRSLEGGSKKKKKKKKFGRRYLIGRFRSNPCKLQHGSGIGQTWDNPSRAIQRCLPWTPGSLYDEF